MTTAADNPSSPVASIVVDPDDEIGPPRRNGELVFDAPWQGRAFGMCIAVLEREGLGWDAFREHLVRAISARPDADYYDCFGEAFESFVTARGLID